jgi:predicted glutamine amidotransferase
VFIKGKYDVSLGDVISKKQKLPEGCDPFTEEQWIFLHNLNITCNEALHRARLDQNENSEVSIVAVAGHHDTTMLQNIAYIAGIVTEPKHCHVLDPERDIGLDSSFDAETVGEALVTAEVEATEAANKVERLKKAAKKAKEADEKANEAENTMNVAAASKEKKKKKKKAKKDNKRKLEEVRSAVHHCFCLAVCVCSLCV